MSEWTNVESKTPAEGELVDIQLVSGQEVKEVGFSDGRFWKFRSGNGGHAYEVRAWRPIEKPPRPGRDFPGPQTQNEGWGPATKKEKREHGSAESEK